MDRLSIQTITKLKYHIVLEYIRLNAVMVVIYYLGRVLKFQVSNPSYFEISASLFKCRPPISVHFKSTKVNKSQGSY